MGKFLTLSRLSFRALLSSVRFRGSKKAKAAGYTSIFLLGGISVYVSVIYSFAAADMLAEIGAADSLIPLMAVVGCILAVMMTLWAASGFIFSGKDNDLMLSLPVSAFTVMLSRITALYLEQLLFIGLFMLTSGAAAAVHGWMTPAMAVGILAGIVLLTFLTTLLTTIIAFIIAFITAKFPHHALFETILYFALFLLILAGSFQMNRLPDLLSSDGKPFGDFSGVLFPFAWLRSALQGQLFSLIPLAACTFLPFLAVVWLFSSRYKKILSALRSKSARSDYRLGALKTNRPLSALFRREVKRYFGTSIYFFNTGFGGILLLIGAGYAAVKRADFLPMLEAFGGMELFLPLTALTIGFLAATIDTTCVSISLEGRWLWILKEAPIRPRTIFAGKILLNLLIAWPPVILSTVILSVNYGVDPLSAGAVILLLMAFSLLVSLMGLCINLLFPKLDAVSDAMVVKNSMSAVVSIFSGWVPVLLLTGGYFLLRQTIAFPAYCLIGTAALLLLSAAAGGWLRRVGEKKFLELD